MFRTQFLNSILIFLVLWLLGGCQQTPSQASSYKIENIKLSANREQILSQLGKPRETTREQDVEKIFYDSTVGDLYTSAFEFKGNLLLSARGKTLEVNGEPLKSGDTKAEILKVLGKPNDETESIESGETESIYRLSYSSIPGVSELTVILRGDEVLSFEASI